MPLEQPFSKRHRYSGGPKEISVREGAPKSLRYFVLETASELDWTPASVRPVLCRVLRVPPDGNNWSEYPNISHEVDGLMYGCDWFKVYDIIEALHAARRCTPPWRRTTVAPGVRMLRNSRKP
jgi:hypothetical protein